LYLYEILKESLVHLRDISYIVTYIYVTTRYFKGKYVGYNGEKMPYITLVLEGPFWTVQTKYNSHIFNYADSRDHTEDRIADIIIQK